jgi:hypothetical protein
LRAEVTSALWDEFRRLNAVHFSDTLTLAELIVSTRKKYGGYCQPARKKIVVSWQEYIDWGWDETLITFRHEVAHLVHPNHSAAFWALAHQLGCPTDRRRARPPKDRPAGWWKFAYECPVCRARIYRRKRLAHASCGKCDRNFNPRYLMQLVESHVRPTLSAK